MEATVIIQQSRLLINDDPQHADDHLAEAHAVTHTERSSYLRNEVYNNQAQVARDVGDLSGGTRVPRWNSATADRR